MIRNESKSDAGGGFGDMTSLASFQNQASLSYKSDSDTEDNNDIIEEDTAIKDYTISVEAFIHIHGEAIKPSFMKDKPNIISIIPEENHILVYNTGQLTNSKKDQQTEHLFRLQGLSYRVN